MEIARLPLTDEMNGADFDVPIGVDIAFTGLPGVEHQPAIHLLTGATEYVYALIASFGGEFGYRPICDASVAESKSFDSEPLMNYAPRLSREHRACPFCLAVSAPTRPGRRF
jgi:hypothetical protein